MWLEDDNDMDLMALFIYWLEIVTCTTLKGNFTEQEITSSNYCSEAISNVFRWQMRHIQFHYEFNEKVYIVLEGRVRINLLVERFS